MISGLPAPVLLGVGCCSLALALAVVVVVEPGRVRLSLERRRPGGERVGLLDRSTSSLTARVQALLDRRDLGTHREVLERAGVRTPLATVVLVVLAGAALVGLVGLVLGGVLLGLLAALAVPIVVRVALGTRAGRRRKAFGDQLEDSLQLMASSLRAGHSLPQALAAVARDAEEPTREEFSRIINEGRVGRDIGSALDETAERMDNADFAWVSQAIAINREVGGNLAEVLDRVTVTIRERNQLRRQVSALSAEGRLSANVLIAMPFAIIAFLLVANPSYLVTFTESALGYGLVVLAVVMLLIGWLWMRKVTRFTF